VSRSQQSQIFNTATANSGADQTAATQARTAEQGDIGAYEGQLAKYAAENPFLPGGEYDKATDQKLSGVADAGSVALNDALQREAQRTGANASSSIAAAKEAARENTRDLMTGEADATQKRVAGEADYGHNVLAASEVPAQLEQGMYSTSLGGADNALSVGGDAAKTPGFWDTLGTSFASALGNTAGGGNLRFSKAL
jgi:hypothetical protein